jgi:DNA-binding transcriptional ArsR family regulator
MDILLETVADLLKTLSDPSRLRVVEALTLDCQSVSAIIEATELSQPLVSYHLRILSEHGLARAERRGAYTFY